MSLQKKVLLDWLRHCAETGQPCPTNDAICERFGFAGSPTAVRMVKMLEADGAITVERLSKARVVTIVATGERTARPVQKDPSSRKFARIPAQRDVPPPVAKPQWRLPAAIVSAASLDGRPLIEFAQALMMMGLDCWRDDRILSGEPADNSSTFERHAA